MVVLEIITLLTFINMANCRNCGAKFGCGCQLINGLCSACNAAVKQATQSTEFKNKLEPEGLVVSTGTPQEFDSYVKREESRWRKIVKENNIKPD